MTALNPRNIHHEPLEIDFPLRKAEGYDKIMRGNLFNHRDTHNITISNNKMLKCFFNIIGVQ